MPKKHLAVFKKHDGDLSDAVKKVSFSKPDERSDKRYAREVITRFATRVFRTEQPSPAYVEQLVERYAVQRANGLSPQDTLIEPLATVPSPPSFLYMVEHGELTALASTGHEL